MASRVTVGLLVVILVTGSIAIYQQIQISELSRVLFTQSAQIANPTSAISISNFTVTKLNATAAPVMYLVFYNNGTVPASSLEGLLVGVSGGGVTFPSCYDNPQTYFPLYVNESVMIVTPLTCGEIGNTVVLTATVGFLTSHGTITKVFNGRTTITQSEYSIPSEVIENQIGVQTYVIPQIAGEVFYDWSLSIVNHSPNPIVSINETVRSPHSAVFAWQSCVVLGSEGQLSKTNPLLPNYACQIDNNLPLDLGPFELGEKLQVTLTIQYSDGLTTTVTTTAEVLPPYVLYQ